MIEIVLLQLKQEGDHGIQVIGHYDTCFKIQIHMFKSDWL